MAWVEKSAQGWVIRWRADDGTRPVAGPYPSKGDAEKAASEFEARTPKRRRRTAGPRPVDPLTIAQLAALWRLDRMDDEERMKRPGAQTYLDEAKRLVSAVWPAETRPQDVTVAMAKALRKKAGRTSASMRHILRWARGNHGTPFDPMVDEALKPPPSLHERRERLTDRAVLAGLSRARRHGQLALVSCLAVYGWRGITASRADVGDVDLAGARMRLTIKHDRDAWWIPLFDFHVRMLRPLVEGRAPDAPLFVPPRHARARSADDKRQRGRWMISPGGSAVMLATWLRRNVLPGVGSKQLKKFAVSRMLAGEWPWTRPLTRADVRLITGQKSDAIVGRYDETNLSRARAFMAQGQSKGTRAE